MTTPQGRLALQQEFSADSSTLRGEVIRSRFGKGFMVQDWAIPRRSHSVTTRQGPWCHPPTILEWETAIRGSPREAGLDTESPEAWAVGRFPSEVAARTTSLSSEDTTAESADAASSGLPGLSYCPLPAQSQAMSAFPAVVSPEMRRQRDCWRKGAPPEPAGHEGRWTWRWPGPRRGVGVLGAAEWGQKDTCERPHSKDGHTNKAGLGPAQCPIWWIPQAQGKQVSHPKGGIFWTHSSFSLWFLLGFVVVLSFYFS